MPYSRPPTPDSPQNSYKLWEADPCFPPISSVTLPSSNETLKSSNVCEGMVTEPFDYITSKPGKDIRRHLINAFNVWLQIPHDKIEIISDATSILHNASLLIDDIEDSSPLRRGQPAAHTIFGTAQTLNSANYMYFRALQRLQNLGAHPKIQEIYLEELCNLHRGQGWELYWRDNNRCPSLNEYILMVHHKTGGLFRLAIRLMMACTAEADSAGWLSDLASLLGVIFQIRDDYINLQSSEYADLKGFAEDITEGKFSFPIVHAIQAAPRNQFLQGILRKRTQELHFKKAAVTYLEEKGSFRYTRDILRYYTDAAVEMINQHGGNPALLGIIQKLEV